MKANIPDPRFDLVLERVIDVSPKVLWTAWTKPEHVAKWFAPAPWTIVDCEIDLRPGGAFGFVMRSPEGQDYPSVGCYLEVVPEKRLVWTDALLPGYRPSENPFFTAVLTLEPQDGKTHYKVVAVHRDAEGKQRHEEMGFHQGWGQVLEQLIAYAKTI